MRVLPYMVIVACVLPVAVYGQGIQQGLTTAPAPGAVYAVSVQGDKVVGQQAGYAYVMDVLSGVKTMLQTTAPYTGSTAMAISADGRTIVGMLYAGMLFPKAAVWVNGIARELEQPATATSSTASGVNRSGTAAVGHIFSSATQRDTAAVWNIADGSIQTLSPLTGDHISMALGVSGDGQKVVGLSRHVFGNPQATLWENGVVKGLGYYQTGAYSTAHAITDDGSVIVGASTVGNIVAGVDEQRAVVWRNGGTVLEALPQINGGLWAAANAVNHDASVIVGGARDGSTGQIRAARWENGTAETVVDWLRSTGVNVAADVTHRANGVSDDGNIVVGSTESGGGFIARARSGLITPANFNPTLGTGHTMARASLVQTDLVLNGAYSMPLRRLVPQGYANMWVTADLARRHFRENLEGRHDIAEIGYSYGLSSTMQAGVAIGASHMRKDLLYDGHLKSRGYYIVPELIMNPHRNLYVSLSAYYQDDNARTARGYDNAGVPDYSRGETDIASGGVRLQLDLKDAFDVANVALTPNISYTHLHTKADGYTEQGGGFPVRWDTVKQSTGTFRLGVDASYNLTPDVALMGRVEGAYRAHTDTQSSRGEIIGISAFEMTGAAHRKTWARFGFGADAKVSKNSKASAMLNVSTEGYDKPDYWLTLHYRITF